MNILTTGSENKRLESLTRRDFLVGAGSVAFLVALGGNALTAAGTPEALPATDGKFLRLSQTLTGKADLNPVTAGRIDAAFAKLQPELHAQFAALALLAGTYTEPATLVEAAGDAKPAALAIIAAWYTGTVGKGIEAVTVAYRDALMQRPADDGLSPPTYAMGGPAWWVAPAPAPLRGQA
ncbi:Membrane bound FAD containing D-sorbitol dehydrogenase [Pseudoxanthomonas sp. GM95]|uniref:sugar dehydrogenase complex small subunit n=1 Tax=Pseudoxanthomonas sp. GM95 TaxID=1881043 RepID=UPI0008D62FC9|nr:sugar dehydrogenase complex small subunit [Pseudoxanthomonas sp. GM95]SEM53072.1 Membrane bound FAD containing D-sorbitol dehydrogenase [Pseudoxanthomonas sp. GM95]